MQRRGTGCAYGASLCRCLLAYMSHVTCDVPSCMTFRCNSSCLWSSNQQTCSYNVRLMIKSVRFAWAFTLANAFCACAAAFLIRVVALADGHLTSYPGKDISASAVESIAVLECTVVHGEQLRQFAARQLEGEVDDGL